MKSRARMEVCARTLGADFPEVEGLNQGVRFRAEFSDPCDEVREEVVEARFEHGAILLQVLDRIPDRAEAMVPKGDPVKHAIQSLIGAVVAEPIVLDALLKRVGEFGWQYGEVLAQGAVALIDEAPEGDA